MVTEDDEGAAGTAATAGLGADLRQVTATPSKWEPPILSLHGSMYAEARSRPTGPSSVGQYHYRRRRERSARSASVRAKSLRAR